MKIIISVLFFLNFNLFAYDFVEDHIKNNWNSRSVCMILAAPIAPPVGLLTGLLLHEIIVVPVKNSQEIDDSNTTNIEGN